MGERGEKPAQGAGSRRGGRMKLHSYTVMHDRGFSPNPFWGYCTLACCKPVIRRTAEDGDWVAGLSSKADGNRLVYAMQIEEILTYQAYYRDSRFAAKIPDYSTGRIVHRCGDNIYKPLPDGGFQQLRSMHSEGTNENPETKAHDLSGGNVLIAQTFYYFGSQALSLPEELEVLRAGRGHKNRFSSDDICRFLDFISRQGTGVHASPATWRQDDDSWRTETARCESARNTDVARVRACASESQGPNKPRAGPRCVA
jgi:hypothetical protein